MRLGHGLGQILPIGAKNSVSASLSGPKPDPYY